MRIFAANNAISPIIAHVEIIERLERSAKVTLFIEELQTAELLHRWPFDELVWPPLNALCFSQIQILG